MGQKIVGNFVVGTVYCDNEVGKWTGIYLLRRYGVNNGRIIAWNSVPGEFDTCEEAGERAMALGEEYAKGLPPDSGNMNAPGSGDELFIPPSAGAQRTSETP